MHQFNPRWDDSSAEGPDLGDFQFSETRDVIDYCEQDRASLWRTWPEMWHLDDEGRLRCSTHGSSILCSVQDYADNPRKFMAGRRIDVGHPCPSRWVMIEPRHELDEHYAVTEADAEAFVRLSKACDHRGITLLDVVILNQDPCWWSMRELTTGTTAWPTPSPRRRPPTRDNTVDGLTDGARHHL